MNRPDHALLPELRSRHFVLVTELRNLNHVLAPLLRKKQEQEQELEEVKRKILENDFYRPPPRPSV